MGEYFKPLRQKIGVLTLAMACLFAAGWVRSMSRLDVICLNGNYCFTSGGGRFLFSQAVKVRFVRPDRRMLVAVVSAEQTPMIQSWSASKVEIYSSFHEDKINSVPYWSIVAPMTLLSAWLLFSKPRSKWVMSEHNHA